MENLLDGKAFSLYKKLLAGGGKLFSFDIFDTLVTRETSSPKGIFLCVEQRALRKGYDVKGFARYRRAAEVRARRMSASDEITLSDIYACLAARYDSATLDFLKSAELEAEIDLTYPIGWVVAVYRRLIDEGRKVVLISDMYLNEETVRAILDKCGIRDYAKLYLSSTHGVTKASGRLFDKVFRDFGIMGNDLHHCGDSRLSDYEIPLEKGVRATLLLREDGNRKAAYRGDRGIFANHPISAYSSMEKNKTGVTENVSINDYAFHLGFCFFGPLLYSFSRWLHQKKDEQGIDKLFFLSRDGFVMRKSYTLLYPEEETEYLYASRRSYEVPSLCYAESLGDVLESIRLPRRFTAVEFAMRVGLGPAEARDVVSQVFDSECVAFNRDGLINNPTFKRLWEGIELDVRSKALLELKALSKYLKKSFLNVERVGIVDIGWHGSMQKAMSKIVAEEDIPCSISGFYTGLYNSGSWEGELPMWGYLFSKDSNCRSASKHIIYNSFYELLFTAPHGSVECFRIAENGESEAVLLDYELDSDAAKNPFLRFQEGALCFVRAAKHGKYERYLPLDLKTSLTLIESIGLNPDARTSDLFGDYSSYNVVASPLAQVSDLRVYVRKPRRYLLDLKRSLWRPAFLKRTLRLPLNYGIIIYFVGAVLKRYR